MWNNVLRNTLVVLLLTLSGSEGRGQLVAANGTVDTVTRITTTTPQPTKPPPTDCTIIKLDDGTQTGFCASGKPLEGDVEDIKSEEMEDMTRRLNEMVSMEPELFNDRQSMSNMAKQEFGSDGLVDEIVPVAESQDLERCVTSYSKPSVAYQALFYPVKCRTRYYWYSPYWIYSYNRWFPVAWIPNYWYQWNYWGLCSTKYCRSWSTCNYVWYGRCVQNWTWRRFIVYTCNGLVSRWVRIPSGCCCQPWSYYNLLVKG